MAPRIGCPGMTEGDEPTPAGIDIPGCVGGIEGLAGRVGTEASAGLCETGEVGGREIAVWSMS